MNEIVVPDVVEFESKTIDQKHTAAFCFVGDRPAAPLRFSVEARAEGIPDWDGPDYQFSAYPALHYQDGTILNDRYLCFAAGTHPWQRLEIFLRPRLPLNRITINYFFEHKIGKVAYRNARLIECAPKSEPDKRIVLLGDSNVITSYLAEQDRVDTLLQARLAAARPGMNIEVENAGVNGDSVRQFFNRKRYERDLLTLGRIDVIFIRFGGNDRKIYSAEEFEKLQRELIGRLKQDFPGIKIVMETGTFLDYPTHYNTDMDTVMAPYHEVARRLGAEMHGVVDLFALMQRETAKGNWDLRFRRHPHWKLILDGRFDAELGSSPDYFSNGHHNRNCNRLIAEAEFECLMEKKLI